MKKEIISRKKQELTPRPRFEKKESQPLLESPALKDRAGAFDASTPFYPGMEEHAALLEQTKTSEQAASLLLHLQRSYGNAYVQRLVEYSSIQAKLNISSPEDKQEIEAEQVAQQVINMSQTPTSSQRIQEQSIASFQNGSGLESRIMNSRGGGVPISDDVRSYMEPRFGADLSNVRMHTDSEAAHLSHSLNAQAFTLGSDIYFGEGKYNPGTQSGKQLLAHELTHVIQQGGARLGANLMPVFGWSQYQPKTKTENKLAENGDDDTAPDYDAPVDTQVDTILEGHTSGENGRPGVSRQETSVIQRNGTVVFPSWATITGDSTIKSETDTAWQETLNATTKTTRREQSFWIKWNSKSNVFSVSQKRTGPLVNDAQTASVSPGAKPADAGDEYSVGLFHTHTPTRYRSYGRGVGPSGVDKTYHNNNDIPGLVYDYVEDKGGNIPAKHPLKAPAKLYDCGPNRRTTKP